MQGPADRQAPRALARVNLAAVERNCRRLVGALTPPTRLCAVVKADAYGHGAQACARAALSGGASVLAVATAQEAVSLRNGGVRAPLIVLGALTPGDLEAAIGADADIVAWSEQIVSSAAALGRGRIHVKLDTGMGRLGTTDPEHATRVVDAVARSPQLQLAGAMTHLANADELGDGFMHEQLGRFAAWINDLRRTYDPIAAHAANSAATLREPASHYDMVRCGVAIYGMDPFGEDPLARELEPALELLSCVAALKPRRVGDSAGYGRRFVATQETVLGVLPLGYGDGWRRALSNNAEVLIGGRRRPVVGTISMDSLTVDLGLPPAVAEGALAVLIGADGSERVGAEEIARRLGTINYEVTCGIGARVPRAYHRDGQPLTAPVADTLA